MVKSKVTKDLVAKAMAAVEGLAKKRVLVGIPAENAPRSGDKINNAGIGYIHEFGAPEANIPARPHLIPGVNDAQGKIVSAFRTAAKKAVTAQGLNMAALEAGLNQAGLAAQNAVRRKINQGLSPALSPNTLRARDRKLLRKARKDFARGKLTGYKVQAKLDARKPLLDTGDYRNKITYAIRNAKT